MHKLSIVVFVVVLFTGCAFQSQNRPGIPDDLLHPSGDSIVADTIVYHAVRVDDKGHILPWYSTNPGEAYDFVITKVWEFWKNMEADSNGIPYHMNHQVWHPRHDMRGIGGDQIMMALSSWNLLYDYSGDESIIDNMRFMADYYLEHSLSLADAAWPHLPYPYNMVIHSGRYDGDMILGEGYTQPDKAGSFGYELVHLYKKTGDRKYLDAAIRMADVLAEKVQPGDNDHSPWPFKVHAQTGEVGVLAQQRVWHQGMHEDLDMSDPNLQRSAYTTNWTGALGLFEELIELGEGNAEAYQRAFDVAFDWMQNYPVKTNKWGPFFEDVPRWSDTQINAVTYAMFLMEHPELDANWQQTVKGIFEWVHEELGNHEYELYGVIPTNEQTAYRVPGNSHSSRQASMELRYAELTGDTTCVRNAVRQLNWATYMVDTDGKNYYPKSNIWMTDGYGDYVRHYLRAMAAAPELAPEDADHLLRTSSIVQNIRYEPSEIVYRKFDAQSEELFRLTSKPTEVQVDGVALEERGGDGAGWTWEPLATGGVLVVRSNGREVRLSL